MLVKSTTNGKLYSINLTYVEEHYDFRNNSVSPDCFDDLEPNFPVEYPERDDETDAILAPQEAINNLISWWNGEIDAWNHGEDDSVFGDPAEVLPEDVINDAIERGELLPYYYTLEVSEIN